MLGVLCRAEHLNSSPRARPGAWVQGLPALGSWGPQRRWAASGAPGCAVRLGRGPHGQCPTQLNGEAQATGYELLVAHGLQQHASPAGGRRSGPGLAAGRVGHGGHGRHAPPRRAPAASRGPSSLLPHQQRLRTAGARLGRSRPGRPDPYAPTVLPRLLETTSAEGVGGGGCSACSGVRASADGRGPPITCAALLPAAAASITRDTHSSASITSQMPSDATTCGARRMAWHGACGAR
jgi:hypothetical protein